MPAAIIMAIKFLVFSDHWKMNPRITDIPAINKTRKKKIKKRALIINFCGIEHEKNGKIFPRIGRELFCSINARVISAGSFSILLRGNYSRRCYFLHSITSDGRWRLGSCAFIRGAAVTTLHIQYPVLRIAGGRERTQKTPPAGAKGIYWWFD